MLHIYPSNTTAIYDRDEPGHVVIRTEGRSAEKRAADIVKAMNSRTDLLDALKAYQENYTIQDKDRDNPHMSLWLEIEAKGAAAIAKAT